MPKLQNFDATFLSIPFIQKHITLCKLEIQITNIQTDDFQTTITLESPYFFDILTLLKYLFFIDTKFHNNHEFLRYLKMIET